MRPDCKKCVFRTEYYAAHLCDYASITGRTRKAEPPEQCTHFKEGTRIEKPEYRMLEKLGEVIKKRAPGGGAKPKHDWEMAETLYKKGYNDGEISRVMGLRPQAVQAWRKRNDLPANTVSGGRRIVRKRE